MKFRPSRKYSQAQLHRHKTFDSEATPGHRDEYLAAIRDLEIQQEEEDNEIDIRERD